MIDCREEPNLIEHGETYKLVEVRLEFRAITRFWICKSDRIERSDEYKNAIYGEQDGSFNG